MISTKYAGLGDIKCLGLSVGSATERLLWLAYIEKRLMFLCAAKMISAPERDLKLLLGRLQYNAAGRCHSLRHRLREMRTAKVRIDGVPNEALAILLDEAVYVDESREVARIVWWIHQELLGSYEDYLATTNPLADAPTCELIETFLLRLRAAVDSLRAHLDQLGVPESERNLPPRLQKFADAADGAAGAHATNEVRDFAFAVFPDFRAGGAVMRIRIHGIVILVRIVGIGNFAREFFRHGIVAARICRLDRRGTDDHFRSQRLEQINFFLGLLIRDGENHLVAANGSHQRQPHPGIAGGALDDRAAGLQQTLFLGVIDHGDADAVFHRAAGIDVVRFDVNLRLQTHIDAIQPDQRRAPHSFQDVVTFHFVFSGRTADEPHAWSVP